MSKKGLFTALFFFFGLIIFLCLCCISILFIASQSDYNTDSINETSLVSSNSSNKIAVIDIEGIIASNSDNLGTDEKDMVDIILNKLTKARQDENVKAVILRLNTPGGTVFDSDKISKQVKDLNKEKPVVALLEASATSGGYYIAASAGKIVAYDTTVTGSIGVITQIIDLDGLYEKLGMNVITITNTKGTIKAFDNLDDPNSEEYKVLVEVLDDNYESFINTVSQGRNLPKSEIEKIADGSIFSGVKAKELGLVDEIGDFSTAIQIAMELSNITDAQVVLYYTEINPLTELGNMFSAKINPLSRFTDRIKTQPGIYHYYLPENVANN